VHGVNYTGKDASKEGWTIVFENLKSLIEGNPSLDLLLPAPINQLFISREQPLLILG
jgi:hypothetical protein